MPHVDVVCDMPSRSSQTDAAVAIDLIAGGGGFVFEKFRAKPLERRDGRARGRVDFGIKAVWIPREGISNSSIVQ